MFYLKPKTSKGTISYLYKNAIGNLIIGSTKHEQNMFLKDEKFEKDHFRIGCALGYFFMNRDFYNAHMLFINVISLIEHEITLKIYYVAEICNVTISTRM